MDAPVSPNKFVKICIYFWIFTTIISGCEAWDNEDYELFDLVDEINRNFYELLGVKEDASTSDIKRAYRKLSLQLHPDKSDEVDAEQKFRQLVSVYETLKDQKKRDKYNSILVHGLPDWRQPVFYYRRVRKLGLLELGCLLFVIATIGQYLYQWAVYFEKRLTIDDMMTSFRRKLERRKKRARTDDDADEVEEKLIQQLVKPSLTNLLPWQTWRLVVHLVLHSPQIVSHLRVTVQDYLRSRRAGPVEESDEDEPNLVERVRVKPKRRLVVTDDDDLYKETAQPVTYTQSYSLDQSQEAPLELKQGPWSNDDYVMLAKAVARYPGGYVDRWTKIAEFVGRPLTEVVTKSKSLKSNIANNSVDLSLQGATGAGMEVRKAKSALTDDLPTLRPCEVATREISVDESSTNKHQNNKSRQLKNVDSYKTRVALVTDVQSGVTSVTVAKNGVAVVTDDVITPVCVWTQEEQRCLESALVLYTKGTEERWEKISAQFTNKTKEQCMERYKYLAQILKKKRQQTTQPS